jgi:putative nucleotidyltransferase with HDIG domain
MSPRAIYVGAVVAAGSAALWAAATNLHPAGGYHWLLLAALAWLSAPLALRVPGAQLTITVSESFSLMVAIAYGWQPAVITVAADGLLTSLRQRSRRLDRTFFNIAEPALSMTACGLILDWLSGMPPAQRAAAPLVQLVLPGFAAASAYLLLNSALTTAAVALEAGVSALATWRRHVNWLILDQLGATSLALLVIAGARGTGVVGILAALPLLGTLYVAYRSSIRRAEEALEYAERLNRLYLGTVESLAMAIDAKDQVTHGHITRVRRLALGLAGAMGLNDESVVKAIEAGSLLHDVGKLGVPDHILNKPGPLTPEEYDQVKRHTIIGAEIVSRVDYPYPVAPVVRHHHENWDGTGYPDGLRGEDIPVGARILSVIDCYDALTSDRPYRRAMSHEDALAIVAARRGTMYDPAIVDAFMAQPRDHGAVTTAAPARRPPAAAPAPDPRRVQPLAGRGAPPVLAPAATAAQEFDREPDYDTVMTSLGQRLLDMTPATTVALFVPAASGVTLRLAWISGRLAGDLEPLQPVMGRGLSGWVAAHRRTLFNAAGELEFQSSYQPADMPRHALSTPIQVDGTQAVGVLTLYSDDEAFTTGDQELAEALAHAIGRCLSHAARPDLPPCSAADGPRTEAIAGEGAASLRRDRRLAS